MPIRLATYADLLPASKCLARAFKNEPLFGQYMHPYRDQYPEDMYLYFLHKLRDIWASQSSDDFLVVSYSTAATITNSSPQDKNSNSTSSSQATSNTKQKETTTITGLAHWTRMRNHNKPKQTLSQYLSTSLMTSYNYFESFFYPNRAVDPSRTSIMSEFPTYCGHFWTGSRAEVFDLTLLGVDPAASGQGYGKELVAWGFEKAKGEEVGCSVVGADGTEKFYRRCGFDVVVGGIADFGGEENPLVREGIAGGLVMFWDNGRSLDGVKGYGET